MAPTNKEIVYVIKMRNAAKAALGQLRNDMSGAARASDNVAQSTGKARDAMGRFVRSAQQAGDAVNNLKRNSNGIVLSRAFADGRRGAISFSEGVGIATGAIVGLSSAMVAIAGIQAFANLERQLSVFQAVTQASDAEMQKVKETARQMGATTEFSASQAAEALTNFARAGMTVDQSMKSAKASLDFALVAGIDLGESAQITAAIMNQFGIEASRTADIVDVLAKVDNVSAASANSLGEAFKYAGTVANAAGVSMNTLAASFGVLGDAGTLGSMAGTQMQQVISRMLKPTREAVIAIRELGLNIEDMDTQDLAGTFAKLQKAGMTAGQAIRIFGEEGGRAGILLAAQPEKLKRFEDATKSAGGTAAAAAKIIGDNLTGDFRQFQSASEELALALGDAGIGGALRNVVQTATGAVSAVSAFISQIEQGSTAAKVITTALTGIAVGLGAMAAGVGIIAGLRTAMLALNVVMAANPVLLIIGGVVALGAAIYSLRNETVQWGDATVSLGDIVTGVWSAIRDGWNWLYNFITTNNPFTKASDSAAQFQRDGAISLRAMATAVATFIRGAINLFIAYQASVLAIFDGIGRAFRRVLVAMYENAKEFVTNVSEGFKALMSFDFDAARQAFAKDLSRSAFAEIEKTAKETWEQIKENFQTDYVGEIGASLGAVFDEIERRAKIARQDRLAGIKDGSPTGGATSFENPNQAGPKYSREDNSQASQFAKSFDSGLQKLREEAMLIGLNSRERDRMVALMEIEAQTRQAGVQNAKAYIDQYMGEYDALQKLKDAYQNNPLNGLRAGFDDFIEENLKFADKVKDAWTSALDGVADSITDLVFEGKNSFGDMLKSFGKQLFSAGLKNLMAKAFQGLGLNVGQSMGPQSINTSLATITAGTVNVNGATVASGGFGIQGVSPGGGVLPGGSPLGQGGIGSDYAASLRAASAQAVKAVTGSTDIASYIKLAATARGIDPNVALKVAMSEGGVKSWNLQSQYMKNGIQEPSFGPFQLLKGGAGTGYPTGLGNEFMRRTGLDPAMAQNGPAGVNFALDHAAKNGWGAWYGAAKAGIGNQTGIGTVDPSAMQQAQQQLQMLYQQGAQQQIMTVQQTQQQLQQVMQTGSQQQVAQAQQLSQNLTTAQQSGNQQQIATAQTAAQEYINLSGAVQQAGTSAASAAPQISGMQTKLGTATPQLGNFGQGIGGLLGPLSQAIPGLGGFAQGIMGLLSSLGGIGGGGGGFGGIFSLITGLFHTGGKIGGIASAHRSVSPAVFANAKRYHSGGMIKKDEVPIIGQVGERVLNRDETKAYNAGLVNGGFGSSAGGGGSRGDVSFGDINIGVTNSGQGSGDPAKDAQNNKALGKQLATMVRKELTDMLIEEKRPGGLLYGRS